MSRYNILVHKNSMTENNVRNYIKWPISCTVNNHVAFFFIKYGSYSAWYLQFTCINIHVQLQNKFKYSILNIIVFFAYANHFKGPMVCVLRDHLLTIFELKLGMMLSLGFFESTT